jgi:hypothetical protein
VRAGWKIFYAATLLALLIPGLALDFLVPGSPLVRKLWGLAEIFLFGQIVWLLWLKKTPGSIWPARLAKATDEEARRFFFHGLTVALALDGARLAMGMGFFGPIEAPYLETFNPTFWGICLVSIEISLILTYWAPPKPVLVLAMGALIAHQLLLWLSKDIFAARFQSILYLLLAFSGPGRIWPRAGLLAFAVLTLFGESWFLNLGIGQGIDFPWPDPKVDQLPVYDRVMSNAAIFVAGDWGLGLEYWEKLDFFRPGPMPVYALAYLAIWLGSYGTIAYLLAQSFFLSFLALKSQSFAVGWPRVVVWSLSRLMTLNLLLSVVAAGGFMGLYDPIGLAFVGNNQVGALLLAMTFFIVAWEKFRLCPPGRASQSRDKG